MDRCSLEMAGWDYLLDQRIQILALIHQKWLQLCENWPKVLYDRNFH